VFDYVDRGSEDELGVGHNRLILDDIRLLPNVLCGGEPRSAVTTLFGESLASPLVVAPTAFAGLLYHQGEIELAAAAKQAGIVFCAATEAITSIEDIARHAGGSLWFQLYLWRDLGLSLSLIDRAWACGVRTLVVTVDTPVFPKREYNQRNGFGVPFRFSARNTWDVLTHPRWGASVLMKYWLAGNPPKFANYPPEHRQGILSSRKSIGHEPSLNWDHVRTLRRHWKGNLVLKGILRADDAVKAANAGADGIVVSNHGARNLDSAVAPAQVLQAVAEAVDDRLTVMCDSGVQRGSDVLKLLALGAKAVWVGRAFLYALAVGGRAGACSMAAILANELDRTMAMVGCEELSKLAPHLIYRKPS